jgi:hypothetical protein
VRLFPTTVEVVVALPRAFRDLIPAFATFKLMISNNVGGTPDILARETWIGQLSANYIKKHM